MTSLLSSNIVGTSGSMWATPSAPTKNTADSSTDPRVPGRNRGGRGSSKRGRPRDGPRNANPPEPKPNDVHTVAASSPASSPSVPPSRAARPVLSSPLPTRPRPKRGDSVVVADVPTDASTPSPKGSSARGPRKRGRKNTGTAPRSQPSPRSGTTLTPPAIVSPVSEPRTTDLPETEHTLSPRLSTTSLISSVSGSAYFTASQPPSPPVAVTVENDSLIVPATLEPDVAHRPLTPSVHIDWAADDDTDELPDLDDWGVSSKGGSEPSPSFTSARSINRRPSLPRLETITPKSVAQTVLSSPRLSEPPLSSVSSNSDVGHLTDGSDSKGKEKQPSLNPSASETSSHSSRSRERSPMPKGSPSTISTEGEESVGASMHAPKASEEATSLSSHLNRLSVPAPRARRAAPSSRPNSSYHPSVNGNVSGASSTRTHSASPARPSNVRDRERYPAIHSHATSRPVISSNALSQLTKSLSGGTRRHRPAAVAAE